MKLRRHKLWSLENHGVTQGAMNTFLQCPRKAHYALRMGLRSRRGSSQALDYGNLVHDLLGDLTLELNSPAANGLSRLEVETAVQVYTEQWLLHQLDGTESSQELHDLEEICAWAEATLPEYFFYWEKNMGPLEWESSEEEFAVKTEYWKKPTMIRGKFDGTYRSHGSLWLMEHKTRSRISPEEVAESLPFDVQVCLYAWALQLLAVESVKGVLYNLIRRPSKRPHKKENLADYRTRLTEDVKERSDFYFMRFEMALIPTDLRGWVEEFEEMVNNLRVWESGDYNYRNPNGCTFCPYRGLCAGSAKISDYRIEPRVFPELDLDPFDILNRRSIDAGKQDPA